MEERKQRLRVGGGAVEVGGEGESCETFDGVQFEVGSKGTRARGGNIHRAERDRGAVDVVDADCDRQS